MKQSTKGRKKKDKAFNLIQKEARSVCKRLKSQIPEKVMRSHDPGGGARC